MTSFDPTWVLLPLAVWLLFGLALAFGGLFRATARSGLEHVITKVLAFGSGILLGLAAAVLWTAVQVIEPFAPLSSAFSPVLWSDAPVAALVLTAKSSETAVVEARSP